jgi:hypothetical protein
MSGIDEVSKSLGRIEAQNHEVFKRLAEIETTLEGLTALKNKGWGVVMAVSVLSAVVGTKLSAVLTAIGGAVK